MIAHDGEAVEPRAAERLDAWLARRADGEPLAYLLGRRAFRALDLEVDARVLDPRPDTETLVDWALEWLGRPDAPSHPSVLDLGTGSGAIALSIAHAWPEASCGPWTPAPTRLQWRSATAAASACGSAGCRETGSTAGRAGHLVRRGKPRRNPSLRRPAST